MKYIDLGRKQEKSIPLPEGKKLTKITYPTDSFVGDAIPEELKSAKNETMHRCEIIVRKIGDSIDTYAEGEPRRIEIEMQKIAYIGKGGKVTKDEYLNMNDDEKEEYDKRDKNIDEEKE